MACWVRRGEGVGNEHACASFPTSIKGFLFFNVAA